MRFRLGPTGATLKYSGYYIRKTLATELPKSPEIVKSIEETFFQWSKHIKHDMLMIFKEILQLDCSGIPYKTVIRGCKTVF